MSSIEHTDQLGRLLQLSTIPQRIISLVPSITELLVDLGLESRLVGVTKFCVHPKGIRGSKTIVGGTKQIKLEKIKALKPDIVLCNKEENTAEIVSSLESITQVHISDIYTLEDCFQLIFMYGRLFNVEDRAKEIVDQIKSEITKFNSARQPVTQNKRVAYFIWKRPWMVAAGNTFIDHMLNAAGFINVYSDDERYPEVDLEDSKLLSADGIFLSSEPFPFKEEHAAELKERFPEKDIRIVDGEMFSWFGSHLTQAFSYFSTL